MGHPAISPAGGLDNEVLLVTFQIVFVGSDGILVGSDRKTYAQPPGIRGARQFIQFEQQSKITRNERVLCACSGNQEASRIAREIVDTLDPDLSEIQWKRELDRVSRIQMEGYAQIVVVRKGWLDHAIWVVAGPQGHTSQIKDKRCIGANTSACFLTENFWPGRQPIQQLIPLALVVLDYARTEFPTEVGGGFELFRVTSDGIAEPEIYVEGDKRIARIRNSFERRVKSTLFP
jgi:hypothetical protein